MGGKTRSLGVKQPLTTDFFSIITKNEKLKNEKIALSAKNERLSKLVAKSWMKIDLLEKETD